MTTALLLLASGLTILGLVLAARYLDGLSWRHTLVAIELHLPFGLAVADIGCWLNSLAAATHPPRLSLLPSPPIVLEVIATRDGVRHILLVPKGLRETVLAGMRASLPGVRLEDLSSFDRPKCSVAMEATLTARNRQLSVQRAEGVAMAVLATLQPLQEDETVVAQWILTGAGTAAPIPSTAKKDDLPAWITGEDLKDGEAIQSARTKQIDAMFVASLRIGASAGSRSRAWALAERVFGQHRGENAPGVMLVRRAMTGAWAASRLARLVVPATGFPLRLSTAETAGLLPIPLGDIALPGVKLGLARQLPPPPGMPTTGAQIGISNYPDIAAPLFLTDADRLQHLHVLGPTGTGKSTLLCRLILQDIDAGHGVVVIDPKSDLVRAVLDRIPVHREQDVIVADPSRDPVVGFNILRSGQDEQGRELVVDNVIHIWHEIYEDFWGPRSEDVLRGALLSLINTRAGNGEPFTLVETPDLLTVNGFRKFVTGQSGVPAGLASFWSWYRGIEPGERLRAIGPILNKLRAATLRTPIRLMLGQSEGLDLDWVLRERKVLLVPLSAGTLGNETANLLGTILLAGVWFAVQKRVELAASDRHPVFIYVDEAQNVLKLPVDLADMLSMARGLGASFTLAHQHLGQIEDKQVKSALLGTVRSQIVFQAQREDAATLAPSYTPFLTANDLMGLARYEFAARLLVDGQTLAPLTATALALEPPSRDGFILSEMSRSSYGKPRGEIEASLKARGSVPDSDQGQAGAKNAPTFGRRRKQSEGGAA